VRRLLPILIALPLAACSSSSREVLDLSVTPSAEAVAEATAAGDGGKEGEVKLASLPANAYATPRFSDNDPHDWTGTTPWAYPVHGIDVAKYQNAVNWHSVRAAGISFAYIKATEGGDIVDDRFKQNWRASKRAGVRRGAYHFFYFCRPAFEQARWFIRNVPKEKGSLPHVLDMEWNPKSPTCKLRPKPSAVRKEMSVFVDRIRRHYGKPPIVYTTYDFYRDNELWKFNGADFWFRSVAGHPADKYPNENWTFWQYTGTGVVPGVSGDTDINVFRGTTAQWHDWVAKNAL
jgi:lysozyme